jgi:hypothetical protein
VALDPDSFLVGTDKGVARTDDGGVSFGPVQGAGVVGTPARKGDTISWLLADHRGLLRNTDAAPATWTAVPSSGIAADATTLAYVPSLGLVATGTDSTKPLVASDDGVTWTPLATQPPYRPEGIARAGSGAGTAIWTSHCEGGQPPPAGAVLRLADPAS